MEYTRTFTVEEIYGEDVTRADDFKAWMKHNKWSVVSFRPGNVGETVLDTRIDAGYSTLIYENEDLYYNRDKPVLVLEKSKTKRFLVVRYEIVPGDDHQGLYGKVTEATVSYFVGNKFCDASIIEEAI